MPLMTRTSSEDPVAAPQGAPAEQGWVSLTALQDLGDRIEELAKNTVSGFKQW